ncbi:MAG: SurA N-terminal domain-containing protein [Hyphomicrobiaceae bacterium]
MLDSIRNGLRSIFVKALFALLILSFAVWGIPDFTRGVGSNAVATVGKTEISAEEFQQAVQRQLNALSVQIGRRLTMEQAVAFGVTQGVLSRLIAGAAMNSHAGALGLRISDTSLAEDIRNDPSFAGPDGKFDRAVYNARLRQFGLSEAGFVARAREEEVRQQLSTAIESGIAAPTSLVDTVHKFTEETRVLAYLTLDAQKLVTPKPPTEAELKAHFDANKARYKTPEFRKVAVLLASAAALTKLVPVTEQEIKDAYEATKAEYGTPEKRQIEQLVFTDRAAADAAYKDLKAGKSFADVGKALGRTEKDMALGLVTKSAMVDKKVAETAFKMAKDAVSPPIAGDFATVIVRVTAIEPGKQKTLDEVKDTVRAKLAKERAQQEAVGMHGKVEDERAAGKTLKEVAAKFGLSYIEVAETDMQGKTSAGAPALAPGAIAPQNLAAVLASAFGGKQGVEGEAIDLPDGGYAWVDVMNVVASKEKPFDAVKAQIVTELSTAARSKGIREYADKMLERIKKGTTLEAIAKEVGGTLGTTKPIKRTAQDPALSRAAIGRGFTLAKGEHAVAESPDGKSRQIVKVVDVKSPEPLTKEGRDRLAGVLRRQLGGDLMGSYLAGLQAQFGVSVNSAALRRAVGQTQQ